MLKLRRAIVVKADPVDGPEQELEIALLDASGASGAVTREAIADVRLMGAAEAGDEVVVNVQARDLRLGSGGFDIVHVNLTRGLGGEEDQSAAPLNVMKLNYTSLQHAVLPVEDERVDLPLERPVGVLALHGQLAPVAWAFAQAAPGRRLGYVQSGGGALPGGHSRVVSDLRRRGLLAGHLTAGAAFGGEGEAVTVPGAVYHGLHTLGWDAALCGPGPGIVGSRSPLGHGGMAALDSAHAALALGAPTLLVARMSSGRSASAPPWDLPSHPHGARPAARAGYGGAACRDALACGGRPACRPGLRVRSLRRRAARSWNSTSIGLRGSRVTTGATPRWTCLHTPAVSFPRRRWAVVCSTILCSSAPPSRVERRWPTSWHAGIAETRARRRPRRACLRQGS